MGKLLTVPKGTEVGTCPRRCGNPIYWIEKPRADGRGIVRVPVDCSVDGGSEPDSFSPGKGVNHFEICEVEP